MEFLFALSALFSIGSGIASMAAANKEADAQRDQADLQREESEREARRIEKVRKAQRSKLAMRFVKGGVTLADSPLLLLDEQRKEDTAEVATQRTRGGAQQRLGFKRSRMTEKRGRAAFIGSIGQAAFSGAKALT